MHYVQKKALLAIISMIESGLREIRQVLVEPDHDEAEQRYTPVRPRQEPQFGSPLDDAEEQSLEKVMEQSRQDMLKKGVSMTQAFYDDAGREPHLGDFFEGDDT